MYMFVMEVLQKSKYHLTPRHSVAHRKAAPSIFNTSMTNIFLQVYNFSVVGQEKCDIDKGALWPKPVKDNCSNNRNVDLSKSDSQFDSQIDRYISCILIERGEHGTMAPGGNLLSKNDGRLQK